MANYMVRTKQETAFLPEKMSLQFVVLISGCTIPTCQKREILSGRTKQKRQVFLFESIQRPKHKSLCYLASINKQKKRSKIYGKFRGKGKIGSQRLFSL